ncbi:DUF3883 domain-containing protein [Alteromonadaceae bacterium A_SAG1]|nr:DUF3883 domain-containing protein [Alteromonadaceae bacterium A_SAG1]
MNRTLKALHVIEKKDDESSNLKEVNKATNTWESGFWKITEKRAKELVGGELYIHKGQKKPSHKGGVIKSYRMVGDRALFTFVADSKFEGIEAHKKWGNEKRFSYWGEEVAQPLKDLPMIFVFVGWMEKYRGDKGDRLINGGRIAEERQHGVEVCNFKSHKGKVYGNFGSSKGISAKGFEKLGGSKFQESVTGTVVWIAKNEETKKTVVVGWYKNAEIYRMPKKLDNPSKAHVNNALNKYHFATDQNQATLINSKNRILEVPKGEGGKGQNFIWYADSFKGAQFKSKVIDYISEFESNDDTFENKKGFGKGKCDPEKNKVVEQAAIDFVSDYYVSKGFEITSVEADNVGYDLLAVSKAEKLYIEVKGLSGKSRRVGISPNEYDFFSQRKPSYVLAIVSEALSNNPRLTLCQYSKKNGDWYVVGDKNAVLKETPKTAAIIEIK